MDEPLTDKEKEFLKRKNNKDKMTTAMRAKEAAWLRKEHERSMNRLPNEYRHTLKGNSAFPSREGNYTMYYDD